jgi:hypothetical protein
MVGSIGVGYWIAHGVFWLLIVFALSESRTRLAPVFVGLWLIGYAGSGWISQGAALFVSYVALLDVALVLALFRGDVRLT